MSKDSANVSKAVDDAPRIRAEISPATARLGDLLRLDIRVTHPDSLIVEDPAFAKSLGTFEIYASTRLPSEVKGSERTDRFQAVLQNFSTGQQLLPGLEVPTRDPMGKIRKLKTPELKVAITEVPPGPKDKGDIRGIKGVIGPTAWSAWWWALLGAIVVGAAAYAWTRRRKIIQGPPPPPPVPADMAAMEKLQRLARIDWFTAGKTKEYYSAISDILREYLEKGFKTAALERTTSELMRDLRKKSEIHTELQAQLRELLDTCDLVKFAKFRPEPDEGKTAHAAAVRFVEQTRSVIPVIVE